MMRCGYNFDPTAVYADSFHFRDPATPPTDRLLPSTLERDRYGPFRSAPGSPIRLRIRGFLGVVQRVLVDSPAEAVSYRRGPERAMIQPSSRCSSWDFFSERGRSACEGLRWHGRPSVFVGQFSVVWRWAVRGVFYSLLFSDAVPP